MKVVPQERVWNGPVIKVAAEIAIHAMKSILTCIRRDATDDKLLTAACCMLRYCTAAPTSSPLLFYCCLLLVLMLLE